MLTAKWNSQKQEPYDIKPRNQVLASNGVPYKSWESLNAIGRYEYIPVALADGERLDNVTYTFESGVIHQQGDVIDAQVVAAERQVAAQSILDDTVVLLMQVPAAVSAVSILAQVLSLYGLTIPCGGYQGALATIGQMQLTDVQTQMLGSLDTLYRAALSICGTDEVVTGVWKSINEGQG